MTIRQVINKCLAKGENYNWIGEKINVSPVKEYNQTIAQNKWNNCDKTKCIPSMFFFYLDNEQTRRYGYNILRQKGYVAFDENRASFGMNEDKAINRFNQ